MHGEFEVRVIVTRTCEASGHLEIVWRKTIERSGEQAVPEEVEKGTVLRLHQSGMRNEGGELMLRLKAPG